MATTVLVPGMSIGNENSGSLEGSITCFGTLRSNPAVKVMISNSHVIFHAGGQPPLRIGSPNAGCCRCCCHSVKNIVAKATSNGFERAQGASFTYIDCAYAELNPGIIGVNRIASLNSNPKYPNYSTTLKGYLKGTAVAVDGEPAFIFTRSLGLIKCTILGADAEITANKLTMRHQILLQVDPGFEIDEESGSGDSGSAVIDSQNRIIGIMHSRGASKDMPALDRIIACPIQQVMDSLQVDIPAEPDPSPSSAGIVMEDVPVEIPQHINDQQFMKFEKLALQSQQGAILHRLGFLHGQEIISLVNHCRAVTVAWHRNHGPAWAVHLLNSARDSSYVMPQEVKGIGQRQLLEKMAQQLQENGSDSLRRDLEQFGTEIILLSGFNHITELLKRLNIESPSSLYES